MVCGTVIHCLLLTKTLSMFILENCLRNDLAIVTHTNTVTSSVEKPRHVQQFTPLTNFGERPSAESPN